MQCWKTSISGFILHAIFGCAFEIDIAWIIILRNSAFPCVYRLDDN